MDFTRYYESCNLCPRRCGVNRHNSAGFCGEGAELRLACASIHRGEEPPISGTGGSGTVFVSGCNLGCVFCQNYQISRPAPGRNTVRVKTPPMGNIVSVEEFARICRTLQEQGAENINIVTGSHAIPALAAGLDAARAIGVHIPVLWNTSSYETTEALELLRGRVDVFLPDLKTLNADIAGRFFKAHDYPAAAEAAIRKMMEMAGGSTLSGEMTYRVIIRHLILPGFLESTRRVLRWFADNAMRGALLSLMAQYTPPSIDAVARFGNAAPAGIPARYVNKSEYETVLGWLDEFGIDDGYCQELVTGSDWLPDFGRLNPFSSELSKPVWHWNSGIV